VYFYFICENKFLQGGKNLGCVPTELVSSGWMSGAAPGMLPDVTSPTSRASGQERCGGSAHRHGAAHSRITGTLKAAFSRLGCGHNADSCTTALDQSGPCVIRAF
jgi:hypothetical protein